MRPRTITGTVEPLVYTAQQAGEALGIGVNRVYTLIESGSLRAVKIGRRRMVPITECHAWLARQLEESP